MKTCEIPKTINRHGGKRPGSGRKKGIPNKATVSLKNMTSQYTEQALTVLVELMQDLDTPATARIQAAREVLDRGHGKPTQSVDVLADIAKIDTAELDRIYEKNMSKVSEFYRIAEERRRLLKEGRQH
ncbi:MAG: hypothetical protein ACXW1Z_22115 [Methylobacter sp.]